MFLFDLSKRDFDTDDDEIASTNEGPACNNRKFQCSDSNSESDSCSKDTSGCIIYPSQSKSDNETCDEEFHSNFQKLCKIMKMMIDVSQSLKVSIRKVT